MKLDLLYEVQAPKPWPDKPYPYNQREAEQAAYFEAIEQIKLADKLGFGTVWVVEHHFRIERSHMPVNDVFLAALSQVTEQIRLGFGVTLDAAQVSPPGPHCRGRRLSRPAEPWPRRMGYRAFDPHEQKAFGVDAETSRDSWREAIEAIVAMWEQEKFNWDSDFMKFPEFPSYEGDTRSITPKPYQDPHPPAWMAAVSPGSVELRRTARPRHARAHHHAAGRRARTTYSDLPGSLCGLHKATDEGEEQQSRPLHTRPLRRGYGES